MKKNKQKKITAKKLGNTAARKKKATVTRNAFRRALYRANKMIASGNSFYTQKLSMKEFKREYNQFGKRTGMLTSKNLDKNLKTFVQNEISSNTPKQCEAAAANLKKHLSNAVIALNKSKGGIDTISDTNKKYIVVLRNAGAIETKENKNGEKVISIIKDKLPTKDDFINVSDKYLKFKRLIIAEFGSNEYGEAYGS